MRRAVEQGRPYAVIFLDMRMPGMNGLETAIEIRKHDVKAEIVFITAYSDCTIEEIVEQAGQNVGYHCKPYASEEIIQIATKAVTDYNKLRNLEKLIETKLEGKEVKATPAPKVAKVVDIMDALRKSLSQAKPVKKERARAEKAAKRKRA